jgi:hypothetical protein
LCPFIDTLIVYGGWDGISSGLVFHNFSGVYLIKYSATLGSSCAQAGRRTGEKLASLTVLALSLCRWGLSESLRARVGLYIGGCEELVMMVLRCVCVLACDLGLQQSLRRLLSI